MARNLEFQNCIAGVDNIVFDQRPFDLTAADLAPICSFFGLGPLLNFQQERNVTVSHSNFFVDVRTTKGRFALKFYPCDAKKLVLNELVVNRFLTSHCFPTPLMYADHQGTPFFLSRDKLTTCYEFIPGTPAWQHIQNPKAIDKLIENISLLKKVLLSNQKLPSAHQESLLTTTLHTLAATPFLKTSGQESKIIRLSLRQALKTVTEQPLSFKRQRLHNNTTLTNFIFKRNTVYTLDLSHIREDYALSDLSALIISGLFLETPGAVIHAIIRQYFIHHQLAKDDRHILSALLTTQLIKEYVKNDKREQQTKNLPYSSQLSESYLFHLKARKNLIISTLKKISGSTFFKL